MKRSAPWLIACGTLLVVAALPMLGQGTEPTMPMEQAIEKARTRANHEALASRYELEAKTLKDKVEEHRKLVKTYSALAQKGASTVGQHCEALASCYQKAAQENLELATLHRQLAAEATQ